MLNPTLFTFTLATSFERREHSSTVAEKNKKLLARHEFEIQLSGVTWSQEILHAPRASCFLARRERGPERGPERGVFRRHLNQKEYLHR